MAFISTKTMATTRKTTKTTITIPTKAALAVPKISRKVLMMMMKAAKLGWVGPGARQEQDWSKAGAGLKHGQGRSRAGTGQEQS